VLSQTILQSSRGNRKPSSSPAPPPRDSHAAEGTPAGCGCRGTHCVSPFRLFMSLSDEQFRVLKIA
jgi:hypothetical protein